LSHLIFEGTLDRFPGLKICSAHGGGYLPSYAPRSDNSLRVAPDMDTGIKLKKKPTEYLKTMYYDTLVFTSEALRHLAAEVGVGPVALGRTWSHRLAMNLEHAIDQIDDPVVRDPCAGIGRRFPASRQAQAQLRDLDDERRAPRMRIDVITGRAPHDADVRLWLG